MNTQRERYYLRTLLIVQALVAIGVWLVAGVLYAVFSVEYAV
jgi:hypothetical protein